MKLEDKIKKFLNNDYNTLYILGDIELIGGFLDDLGFKRYQNTNWYIKDKHQILLESSIANEGHTLAGSELYSVILSYSLLSTLSVLDIMYLRSRIRGKFDEPKLFILGDTEYKLKSGLLIEPF